jgi:O-antigen ligase
MNESIRRPVVDRRLTSARRVDVPERDRAKLEPLLRWLLVANVVSLPILVPRGPENTVPADLPATLLIVLGAACLWRMRQPVHLPMAMSYTLIVTGGLVAAGQSVAPRIALTAVVIDVYLFVWFVVVLNCLLATGNRGLRWVISTWIAVAACIGVLAALAATAGSTAVPKLFGYPIVDKFERFYGTFRDPNMAGNFLVVSLFVVWASPLPRRTGWKVAVSLPLLLAIQATKSNTALAALAAGVLVMVCVSLIRSRKAAAGAAVAAVGLALLVFAVMPARVIDGPANLARSLGDEAVFQGSLNRFDSSLGARVERIDEALGIFGPDVLLGIGPSTTNDTLIAIGAPITGELHNDFVAALIERGLLGIVGVVALFVLAIRSSFQLVSEPALRRDGWRTVALLGAVTSVVVSALSLETLHFRHVWFLFALVYALGYTAAGLEREEG